MTACEVATHLSERPQREFECESLGRVREECMLELSCGRASTAPRCGSTWVAWLVPLNSSWFL
jgi:hypothetical protein